MYRTPPEREPEVQPPRELIYDATDETAGRADGMSALFRHVSLPIIVCMVATWLAGSGVGTAALVGAVVYSVWSWRTRKKRGGAVLRIERNVLSVEIRADRELHDRIRLGDLADVVLDTKTIERVQDGTSAIPGMRLIDSKVGPKVDTCRIVLVGTGGREVLLTKEYLPHMHATEWLGKIRTFLRKHGWEPESEREPKSRDENEGEKQSER
jgi:hypothetical protein